MKLNKYLDLSIFNKIVNDSRNSNENEEKYTISWTSSKEHIFELPIAGTTTMRLGENLLYFSRKEQCLALAALFKIFKITDLKIFRLFSSGKIQYLYPKDGIVPERVNKGRILVNYVPYSIGNKPFQLNI
jgi:photosystem I subunit 2